MSKISDILFGQNTPVEKNFEIYVLNKSAEIKQAILEAVGEAEENKYQRDPDNYDHDLRNKLRKEIRDRIEKLFE